MLRSGVTNSNHSIDRKKEDEMESKQRVFGATAASPAVYPPKNNISATVTVEKRNGHPLAKQSIQ